MEIENKKKKTKKKTSISGQVAATGYDPKDTERLNWMQRKILETPRDFISEDRFEQRMENNGKDYRDAIDYAMEQEGS